MHPQGGANRERGASLVEFALLVPVLFMVLMGTLTGGLTLSRQNSVENAVREATRFGAVLPDFDDADNLTELYKQVVNAATGDLGPGVEGRQICVALIEANNRWDYAVYGSTNTPTSSGSNAEVDAVPDPCVTASDDTTVGADTQRVWVRAIRTSEIKAILYTETVRIESRSMSRYER